MGTVEAAAQSPCVAHVTAGREEVGAMKWPVTWRAWNAVQTSFDVVPTWWACEEMSFAGLLERSQRSLDSVRAVVRLATQNMAVHPRAEAAAESVVSCRGSCLNEPEISCFQSSPSC